MRSCMSSLAILAKLPLVSPDTTYPPFLLKKFRFVALAIVLC